MGAGGLESMGWVNCALAATFEATILLGEAASGGRICV
jgi:hypothetical protein